MVRRPGQQLVVERLRARLHGRWSDDGLGTSLASDLAEASDRVKRLHRLGAEFAHVRLSRHVVSMADETPRRSAGGSCVAREGERTPVPVRLAIGNGG